jgi:hypothetical protein
MESERNNDNLYLLKVVKEIDVYENKIKILYIKKLDINVLDCVQCYGNFKYNYNQNYNYLYEYFKQDHLINQGNFIKQMRQMKNIPLYKELLSNLNLHDLNLYINALLYVSYRFDPIIRDNVDFFEGQDLNHLEPPITLLSEEFDQINMNKKEDNKVDLLSHDERLNTIIEHEDLKNFDYIIWKG